MRLDYVLKMVLEFAFKALKADPNLTLAEVANKAILEVFAFLNIGQQDIGVVEIRVRPDGVLTFIPLKD